MRPGFSYGGLVEGIAFGPSNRVWRSAMGRTATVKSPQAKPAPVRTRPHFRAELAMASLYGQFVAGIDEAGRGPWAGPVVAAAAILDTSMRPPKGLNDSKQVEEPERETLYALVVERAVAYGIGMASHEEIDAINIRQATHLAMRRAVAAMALKVAAHALLIDGDDPPLFELPTRALVKGDGSSFSIAAASILAKVTRDRMMVELDATHPGYGFARHKGYGTAQHAQALLRLGACPIHRRTYSPVRAVCGGAAAGAGQYPIMVNSDPQHLVGSTIT